MGDKTKIEWTDASWNPIRARNRATGAIGWHCEHVSTGCSGCYAESMNNRLGTGLAFKPGHRKDLQIFLDEKFLLQPMRWKKPRKIFVCSMTDIGASFFSDNMIDRMFAVMALCPQHTFQILTKRPERLREYMLETWQGTPAHSEMGIPAGGPTGRGSQIHSIAEDLVDQLDLADTDKDHLWDESGSLKIMQFPWPLPNVWLGTSVEDQAAADARIPQLLQIPAAIRFLSCEPLLGPLDLSAWLGVEQIQLQGKPHWTELTGQVSKLAWIICGGESGRGARPMHRSWPRSLRDQCAAARVPYHFKQWGEWASHIPVAGGNLGQLVRAGRVCVVHPTGESDIEVSDRTGGRNTIPGTHYVERVGKKLAGRILDGVEHDGFPA